MLRILDQLDQRQTRLGALNVVARVGTRELETRSAFIRRFDEAFLRKRRLDEAGFEEFVTRLRARDSSAARKLAKRRGAWVHAAESWLADPRVLSPVLSVDEARTSVFVDLARQMGVLGGTYGLTELGTVLKALQRTDGDDNPFTIHLHAGEQALLTRILLLSDAVTPFYLRALVANAASPPGADSRTELECLRLAVDELLARARDGVAVTQALAVRGIVEYRGRLESDNAAWHNARPRIEFMIDLGLLGPERDARGLHQPTPAGTRASAEWERLTDEPRRIDQWIEGGFFQSFAAIHELGHRRLDGRAPRLAAIAKAFRRPVARPIGHTPASSVALLACLDLLQAGIVAEVPELLDALREAAHGQHASMLSFSGGSRLDGEFLIRVDPALARALADQADAPGPQPTQ